VKREGSRLARWAWFGFGQALAGLLITGEIVVPAQATNPGAYRLNEAAVAEVQQGNHEKALELLTRAASLDPGDAAIRANLARVRTMVGHLLTQAGRLPEAEVQYRAALDAEPREVGAWLGLGELQLRQRDARGAVEAFRRAVELSPEDGQTRVRLGQAYYNLGDFPAALSEWERASAARPDDAALRERIALVRREAGIQSTYRARESQHFTITYEGRRQEDLGQEFLRLLEQAYHDVGYVLGAYPSGAVPVIFYSDVDFAPATGLSTGVGGFYGRLDGKIRIALRGLTPGDSRLSSLVAHEYTHALIYAVSHGNNPPRWVHEGLAIHMERQRAPQYKEEARRRAQAGTLGSLESSPYVMGSVAIEHLVDRYGMATMRLLLQRLGEGMPFPQAFQQMFRMDLASFERTVQDVATRGY
jgi:tetratricopeptide (TPR) repeat protein